MPIRGLLWSRIQTPLIVLVLLGVGTETVKHEAPRLEMGSRIQVRADSLSGGGSTRVDSLLDEAERAVERGALERASSLLARVRAEDHDTPRMRYVRGLIASRRGQRQQARSEFERALELDSTYPKVRLELGHLAFQDEEFRRALRLYRKETSYSTSALLWGQIGHTYVRLDSINQARRALEKALAQDSTFAPAHGWLGQIERTQGNYSQALLHSKKALKYGGENPVYRYLVGFLSLRLGQIDEAKMHLELVVRQQPWNHGAHYNLGQALLRTGRSDEAQRHLARADTLQRLQRQVRQIRERLREDPTRPALWEDLGDNLRDLGRERAAVSAYDRALEMDTSNQRLLEKRNRMGRTVEPRSDEDGTR